MIKIRNFVSMITLFALVLGQGVFAADNQAALPAHCQLALAGGMSPATPENFEGYLIGLQSKVEALPGNVAKVSEHNRRAATFADLHEIVTYYKNHFSTSFVMKSEHKVRVL